MGVCEFIEGCAFFNDKSDLLEELKEKYCKTNNLNCARYMVANAVGKENMPSDLSPDEKEKAYMVIAENS